MEMDCGAVLGVELAGVAFDGIVARRAVFHRAGAGAHDRLVDGDEEVAFVAAGPGIAFIGEPVGELDAYRAVAFGDDDRSQEVRIVDRDRLGAIGHQGWGRCSVEQGRFQGGVTMSRCTNAKHRRHTPAPIGVFR